MNYKKTFIGHIRHLSDIYQTFADVILDKGLQKMAWNIFINN